MRTLFATALFASAQAIFEGLISVNDSNYEDLVLNDDKNVWVITFYADWCPYAIALEKEIMINSRHMQVAGYQVKYGAVNVRECPELVHRYEVKRSPTIEVYGLDKSRPDKYGGVRNAAALNRYMEEECQYFGLDKAVPEQGYIEKGEYDVEACEADMHEAQDYRLTMYEDHLIQSKEKETKQYEMTKQGLLDRYESEIADLKAEEAQVLAKEEDRYKANMVTYDESYDQKVEDATYEHEEVIKGLRSAYLKDMDLDHYLDSVSHIGYLSEIKAEDYRTNVKVEVTKEHKTHGPYLQEQRIVAIEQEQQAPAYGQQPYGAPAYGAPQQHAAPAYGQQPYGPGVYQAPRWGVTAPPAYGQPQYGAPAPAYGQPQYGAPAYGPPAYGQQPYGAPAYGQPQYGAPAYGAPQQHAAPGYGYQPQYGAPAYGAPVAQTAYPALNVHAGAQAGPHPPVYGADAYKAHVAQAPAETA